MDKDISAQDFYYKLFTVTANEEVYMWNIHSAKRLNKIGSISPKDFQIDKIFLIEPVTESVNNFKDRLNILNDTREEYKHQCNKELLLYMQKIVNDESIKEFYEMEKALAVKEGVEDYIQAFDKDFESGKTMIGNISNLVKYYYDSVCNSSYFNDSSVSYKLLNMIVKAHEERENLAPDEVPF